MKIYLFMVFFNKSQKRFAQVIVFFFFYEFVGYTFNVYVYIFFFL